MRPATNGPTSNMRPATNGPTSNMRPATNGPTSNMRPATNGPTSNMRPATNGPTSNMRPATNGPTSNMRPATNGPTSNMRQATNGPTSNMRPATNGPTSNMRPATNGPTSNMRQATNGPTSNMRPATNGPTSNMRPATNGPTSNMRPATNGPTSNMRPATNGPTSNMRPATNGTLLQLHSSSRTSMQTVMKEALSNNKALHDIFGGDPDISTRNSSMKSLTLSALGTPSISWNQFLHHKDTKSFPVTNGPRSTNSSSFTNSSSSLNSSNSIISSSVLNSSSISNSSISLNESNYINNSISLNSSNSIGQVKETDATKLESGASANQKGETNTNNIMKRQDHKRQGVYISLDKLSRTRRQVPIRDESIPNRRRVLFLLNPNKERHSINRTMLLGPSLMLVPNNTLHNHVRISEGRVPNQQRQVAQLPRRNQLNTVTRKPAIQSIDLSNVDLDAKPLSTPVVGSKGNPTDTSTVETLQQKSPKSQKGSSMLPNNVSGSNQSSIQNSQRQPVNTLMRLSSVHTQGDNVRIGTNPVSNIVQGELPEPRLAHEQPVQSRRIALLLRPNITRGGNTGSFVRTVLPASRRHVMLDPNRLRVQSLSSTGIVAGISRGNIAGHAPARTQTVGRAPARTQTVGRTPAMTRQQQQQQQQPVRRVTQPMDPFTQRFSAGFLRGDQLLLQPDSSETRGFDGSVRTNRRSNFRNRNFNNPPFGGLPPMRPPGFGNGGWEMGF